MPEPAKPSIALAFGAVAPPQSEVLELFVHLGASKEVSSYEVKLANHDGKYSRGGASPIVEGMSGSISLGRGASCPLLVTLKIEDVEDDTTPTESYLTVSGRCWGERLFARTVTKSYLGQKGEAIVKDLIDNYVGLSHNRGGVELIENTDTTYTQLDYEDSPVWDILKYIAETADKAGVIGYDFRVAPDGKFEFFPKNSKATAAAIAENVDVQVKYRRNITRIRNKIIIKGIADKSVPDDKVSWTRSITPADGVWEAVMGAVGLDVGSDGGSCIKLTADTLYYGSAMLTLNAGKEVNCELYPLLDFQVKLDKEFAGTGVLCLFDSTDKAALMNITVTPDEQWHVTEVGVGSAYAKNWEVQAGFDWTHIWRVRLNFYFSKNTDTGDFFVHGLYFGGRRFTATVEDVASQVAYTDGQPREYAETDEELCSDNECLLRAKALLAYLKDPAEYLTIATTLLDFGSEPVLAAHKMFVNIPSKGISSIFHVESVEYRVPEGAEVLEATLELGKEPPKLADYLYGLRTFTVNVEKLSRTKLGKKGILTGGMGGGGSSAGSYFNSNIEIDKISPVLNLLTARSLKAALGHDSFNLFLASYVGDLILRAQSQTIRPYADGSDNLGAEAFMFGNLYIKGLGRLGWLNIDAITVLTNARVLQNVTANASIINEGQFGLARLPRGNAGLVLEAEGAGFDPMYVDPNGRYSPAAHQHSAGDITSGGVSEDVELAKVGGGTRTLHFTNSKYTGYTDS